MWDFFLSFFYNKDDPNNQEFIRDILEPEDYEPYLAAGCFAVLSLALLAYSGLFRKITVETNYNLRPKLTFAYIFDFGGYREATIKLDEYRLLYPRLPRITILYNSPLYPQSNRDLVRSPTFATGLVVSEGTYEVTENIYVKLKELGFNFSTIPDDCFSVSTQFVHHNYLSLVIASLLIFKPLVKFVREKNLCAHPLVQVDKNSTLYFYAPLGYQFDYYVREASDYYGISLVHKMNRIRILTDFGHRKEN
ncbi:testis-expressed protein 264 homolog [Cloeon dipterum]|uniref:testis-expressed protein 264 homolog n=1 Tax=Cloeon dipterum TaxID=197152 RepID=UPI0032200226